LGDDFMLFRWQKSQKRWLGKSRPEGLDAKKKGLKCLPIYGVAADRPAPAG
jgi:hypothetical protein